MIPTRLMVFASRRSFQLFSCDFVTLSKVTGSDSSLNIALLVLPFCDPDWSIFYQDHQPL